MILPILADGAAPVTFPAAVLLSNLALGALLGAFGQVFRVVVGLKKTGDEAKAAGNSFNQHFDGNQILVSLMLGAAAGVAAAVGLWDKMSKIDQTVVMAILAAGYSGSDFIEGFMRKADPAAQAVVDSLSNRATKLPSLK